MSANKLYLLSELLFGDKVVDFQSSHSQHIFSDNILQPDYSALYQVMGKTIVDFEGVKKMLEEGAILIDVRNPGELEETGKIPGAHNIPLAEISEVFGMGAEEFEKKYGFGLPAKDAKNIILSCK